MKLSYKHYKDGSVFHPIGLATAYNLSARWVLVNGMTHMNMSNDCDRLLASDTSWYSLPASTSNSKLLVTHSSLEPWHDTCNWCQTPLAFIWQIWQRQAMQCPTGNTFGKLGIQYNQPVITLSPRF